MTSRWSPASRLQLVDVLERRTGAYSESFFDAHGLASAYRSPGSGSSKQARINAALFAAEKRGALDDVLDALQEYLGLNVNSSLNIARNTDQDDGLPRPENSPQQRLLQAIWDLFYAKSAWPTFSTVDHRLDKQHGLDVLDVAKSMPPGLTLPPTLILPSDDQQLMLTIAGVAACEGSSEDVAAFLDAIKIAAQIEAGHADAADLYISGDALRARAQLPAAGRDALIARVGQLLYAEHWGWRGASAVGEPDWRFTISRGVRRFRSVNTLSEYWSAAKPPESPEPSTEAVMAPVVPNKIFLVHGHDEARHEVARFLERGVDNVEVVELAEQASQGLTIIEKFEQAGETASLAVVLLTPDDVGKAVRDGQERPRARQNVVFELGYFFGRLGRSRVIVLNKGNVEQPSDVSGIVYIPFPNGDWKVRLGRELQAAGLTVDLTR